MTRNDDTDISAWLDKVNLSLQFHVEKFKLLFYFHGFKNQISLKHIEKYLVAVASLNYLIKLEKCFILSIFCCVMQR